MVRWLIIAYVVGIGLVYGYHLHSPLHALHRSIGSRALSTQCREAVFRPVEDDSANKASVEYELAAIRDMKTEAIVDEIKRMGFSIKGFSDR
jgi:hypothetical protein